MTPNEQADPVVIAVYNGCIQPTIDAFCAARPDASPEMVAAITHHAMLMGTSLIRVSRITAGLDRVEIQPGTSEMPTFEYVSTEADTPEKRAQIAAWVSAYLQGGRVGAPLPATLPEESAPPPASDESESVTEVSPTSKPGLYTGQYL